jgi:hypothetical protein
VHTKPTAAELLQTPGAVLTSSHLKELGWTRTRLVELGWHDPKVAGYEPAHYRWLWDMNYAREWPIELGLIAHDLAVTLHEVYSLGPAEDLHITLTRHPGYPSRQSARPRPASTT